MHTTTIDVIGAAGGLLILFGFYRTSIGRWGGRSLLYELDNLLGGVFLIIYSYQKKAYVSIILNLVWAFVAFRGATSIVERRNRAKQPRRKA